MKEDFLATPCLFQCAIELHLFLHLGSNNARTFLLCGSVNVSFLLLTIICLVVKAALGTEVKVILWTTPAIPPFRLVEVSAAAEAAVLKINSIAGPAIVPRSSDGLEHVPVGAEADHAQVHRFVMSGATFAKVPVVLSTPPAIPPFRLVKVSATAKTAILELAAVAGPSIIPGGSEKLHSVAVGAEASDCNAERRNAA